MSYKKTKHNRDRESVLALEVALIYRDKHTQLHSQRVTELSEKIGKACELSFLDIERLKIGSSLHDVGKIGIPDEILLKPGKFNLDEWQVMKSHAEKGQDIISNLMLEDSVIIGEVVRHHHERYDGKGYPDQLQGEEIPVLSRIITLVDSYDAMSERRSYHGSRTHFQSMEMIYAESGTKFDPYVLRKFESVIATH